MHRSPETRMRDVVIACVLVLIAAQLIAAQLIAAQIPMAADPAVMESTKARADMTPSTDPTIPSWRGVRAVYADKAPYGQSQPRYRTEVLSRWTEKNLYFLFVCPYEVLNLKPSPDSSTETFRLWDWDVAEVFIGSDFQNIRRYREFEISPQGEWVNLDIDVQAASRRWLEMELGLHGCIDPAAKIWYGAMRIPFSAWQSHSPSIGDKFRINLFRSQGPPPNRIEVVWQPTMSQTFHAPEKFGRLRLIAEGPE